MNRSLILAAVGLMTAGCGTTIREMRDHEPRALYVSNRSMPALEQCLAERLSWIAMPSIIRGEKYTNVAFGSPGQMAVLVTLHPEGPARTRIEVRQKLLYGHRVAGNVTMCVEEREP